LAGILFAFFLCAIAWLILGGVMNPRSQESARALAPSVDGLWGSTNVQRAPRLDLRWRTQHEVSSTAVQGGQTIEQTAMKTEEHSRSTVPDSNDVVVALRLDQRRKGLNWCSLYDVDFDGRWTYGHPADEPDGLIAFSRPFPSDAALFDNFHFYVDGQDRAGGFVPGEEGEISAEVPIEAGNSIDFRVTYTSRGRDRWSYLPGDGITRMEDFSLTLRTDLDDFDFPGQSRAPSHEQPSEGGWSLRWEFHRIITGHHIGLLLPQRIQPGPLAAAMSFSAPISLGFFFLVIFVLATHRGLDIHPVNYALLGAAFFAFHLLFASPWTTCPWCGPSHCRAP
jgi:hypothetical protein